MGTLIRGNRDLIKEMNRSLLLNIIRREGQLSRKQLTEISGLSVGAVSGIVAEMLANQWIMEVGEGDFTGGRRQTMIKLNSQAGYAVGLKLMEDRAVIAVTNFESRIIEYTERAISSQASPEQIIDEIAMIIQSTLDDSKIAFNKLFGIGIGLAGVIRSKEGIVRYSPFFGWREFPLAGMLEEKLQRPVWIDNDVNTLTLTEQLFGAGTHHANFLVITIGRGIGLGVVINSQLYQGVNGGAGEVGHMILSQQPDVGYRPLEEVAADPAVVAHVAQYHPVKTLGDVVILAEAGDDHAIQALADSGEKIGVGLANVINILNPELVIISGEGTLAGDFRLKPLFAAIQHYVFDGLLDDVQIVVEPTNDQAWARGAASLVISKVFESPIVETNVNA
ncbi:MAG: ROK family transcriptional regulator [Anaerolineaceae bacterium]|nr:ROK family transcriptional regulator [Anaerolineaceae bacterium]